MKKPCIINETTSVRLSKLGFVAALMVVCIHAPAIDSCPTWGLSWWFVTFFQNGLCRVAVPLFFMISGYLIFGRYGGRVEYWRLLTKRWRSIVVPFLIWSTLWFVLGRLLNVVANAQHHRSLWPICLSFHGCCVAFGLDPFNKPLYYPFWYLRTLILFVLLSPIIERIVSKCGLLTIGVCVLVDVLALPQLPVQWESVFDSFMSIRGLAFFVLGMLLRMRECELARFEKKGVFCFCLRGGLLVARCIFAGLGYGNLGNAIQIVLTPIIAVALWCCLSGKAWGISRLSFPIFCIHLYIYLALTFILGKSVSGCAEQILRMVLAIVIATGVAYGLVKKFPQFSSVAFGGRCE